MFELILGQSFFLSIILMNSLFSIAFTNKSIANQFVKEKECLIHSFKYSFEYLYFSKNNNNHQMNACLSHLSLIDDFNKMRWILVPMNNQSNDQFYLRTFLYGDHYLCASKMLKGLFKTKRLLEIRNRDNFLTGCGWKFEKLNSRIKSNSTYFIFNLDFSNQLYSGSKKSYFKPSGRNIYLSTKKSSSENFKWVLDCDKGSFLII